MAEIPVDEKYRMDKIVDSELLNKPKGEHPLYPGELEELLIRLGGNFQLKRRYGTIDLTLDSIEKAFQQELLADPQGDSEVAFLKRVILILITEIKALKGP